MHGSRAAAVAVFSVVDDFASLQEKAFLDPGKVKTLYLN
jgi:hypothetical protein